MDLGRQSDIFNLIQYVCHTFPSKEQVSFNFMAAVTICSDFGAQENRVSPSICHEVMGPDASFLNAEF